MDGNIFLCRGLRRNAFLSATSHQRNGDEAKQPLGGLGFNRERHANDRQQDRVGKETLGRRRFIPVRPKRSEGFDAQMRLSDPSLRSGRADID